MVIFRKRNGNITTNPTGIIRIVRIYCNYKLNHHKMKIFCTIFVLEYKIQYDNQ